MESFKDFETDIMWFKDDESIESNENLNQVNSWHNEGIKNFITAGVEKVGDVLHKSAKINGNQFYGYVDGSLVASAVVNSYELFLGNKDLMLLDHIENCSEKKDFSDGHPLLSCGTAYKILNSGIYTPDHDEVSFIVIDPLKQGKGIGTRVLSSIKNNLGFFAPNSSHYSLSARAHYKNDKSIGILEKNNFHRLNLKYNIETVVKKYYLDEMEKWKIFNFKFHFGIF